MVESILDSVVSYLGPNEEYSYFKDQIAMHINSALSDLHQLGIGPPEGLWLSSDSTLWSDLTVDMDVLALAKEYVYLSVRKNFDPPASSFLLENIDNRLNELKWRIESAGYMGTKNGGELSK